MVEYGNMARLGLDAQLYMEKKMFIFNINTFLGLEFPNRCMYKSSMI